MRLWDTKREKSCQIMLIKGSEEFIKGKFLSDTHIIGCTPSKLLLYDVRKPSIILSEVSNQLNFDNCDEENELNDFDFVKKGDNIRIAICFDSGDTKVFEYDIA